MHTDHQGLPLPTADHTEGGSSNRPAPRLSNLMGSPSNPYGDPLLQKAVSTPSPAGKVPALVTREGVNRTARITGNRMADVALGAGVGGALGLTPGIKYSNYDAQGMPTEANYVVHPMGAAIGAAIGGAAIGGLGRYLDKRDKK